jgi:hypothetical protein
MGCSQDTVHNWTCENPTCSVTEPSVEHGKPDGWQYAFFDWNDRIRSIMLCASCSADERVAVNAWKGDNSPSDVLAVNQTGEVRRAWFYSEG